MNIDKIKRLALIMFGLYLFLLAVAGWLLLIAFLIKLAMDGDWWPLVIFGPLVTGMGLGGGAQILHEVM